MSDSKERILSLLTQQETILQSLQDEAKAIDADLLITENENLKAELARVKSQNETLAEEGSSLQKDLQQAKTALFSKMANEKLAAFTRVQNQIDACYYVENDGVSNKLKAYENEFRNKISELSKQLESASTSDFKEVREQIDAAAKSLDDTVARVKQRNEHEFESLRMTGAADEAMLKNEGLTQTEKKTGLKHKSLESFIGLNILSKAGIVLFLIGIIALGRFAYTRVPDTLKGSIIFGLGILLILVGGIFHKKEKTVFSVALISGGVSVLYAAAATSYFALGLFGVKTAFILCVVITVISLILSRVLNSQTVAAFAAVGGYLPLVSTFMIGFGKAAADKTFLPVSSVYFCLLAVALLILTYNKKWAVAQYIGFSFNLIAVGAIGKCAWALHTVSGYGYTLKLAAAFSTAVFIVYLAMPVFRMITRKPLTVSDTILLSLNSLVGAVSISLTIRNCFDSSAAGTRAVGIVFIILTVLYSALLILARKEPSESKGGDVVLSISVLLFSLLIVPLVFGWQYAAIAWAAEGALIAVLSISAKRLAAQITGLLCMLAALPVYVLFLYSNYSFEPFNPIHVVTYTVVLFAFWAYIVYGLHKADAKNGIRVHYYVLEILCAAGTYAYLSYLYALIVDLPFITISSSFTESAIYILMLLSVAGLLVLKPLRNLPSQISAIIACLFAFIFTATVLNGSENYNEVWNYFGNAISNSPLIYVNLILMISINIIVAMSLAKSVTWLINHLNLPAWVYTITLSLSSLILITVLLIHQFSLKFSSVIISAIYIAIACILLFYGFRKRFTVVRSGGLILILVALAKLCFVDTHALDSGWKIGSYFAFGTVLIVISLCYQYFNKKLEKEAIQFAQTHNQDIETSISE